MCNETKKILLKLAEELKAEEKTRAQHETSWEDGPVNVGEVVARKACQAMRYAINRTFRTEYNGDVIINRENRWDWQERLDGIIVIKGDVKIATHIAIFSSIEEITGSLSLVPRSQVMARKLRIVKGKTNIGKDAELEAPLLGKKDLEKNNT